MKCAHITCWTRHWHSCGSSSSQGSNQILFPTPGRQQAGPRSVCGLVMVMVMVGVERTTSGQQSRSLIFLLELKFTHWAAADLIFPSMFNSWRLWTVEVGRGGGASEAEILVMEYQKPRTPVWYWQLPSVTPFLFHHFITPYIMPLYGTGTQFPIWIFYLIDYHNHNQTKY